MYFIKITFFYLAGLVLAQPVYSEGNFPDDLIIYTEGYAPYNYLKNGEPHGINVELLLEIFKRAGLKKTRHDINLLSWARGYNETLRRKNTMLFTTTRTPLREDLFKWVGPIGISDMALIAQKNTEILLRNNSDFNAYTYASMKNVRGEQALLKAGTQPNRIIHVNSAESGAHILARGRVDAWAYDRIVSFWILQKLSYNPADFKVIHSFQSYGQYFAFNKYSNSLWINKLQQALDTIKADGTFEAIRERHTVVRRPSIDPNAEQ